MDNDDNRLAGPAYLYDRPNADRGGLITRMSLVKKDPYGYGPMVNKLATRDCDGDTDASPKEECRDEGCCSFRERL